MDVEFLRCQYEDGFSGVLTKYRFNIGIRHIQLLYMLASSVSLGLVRGSTGVAVLAINDETRLNDTYIQVHNWDKRIQGAVLSSFFFGYAMTLVPADLYLKRIGGKLILTLILAVNGALCVAMPTIVNKGGWVAACNAQLFMGMSHGCFSSVYETLLERWTPPNERAVFNNIIYSGLHLGIILAFPVSGLLSQMPLGWEFIYYALAMVTLSLAVIIGTLTASTPEEHQAIGDDEKEHINETRSLYRKKVLRRPWRRIVKSPKFWAIACAHAASNALFVFHLTVVPLYFKMQGLPKLTVHYYSAMPFGAMWISNLITTSTLDWMLKFGCMDYIFNMTYFRKLINALGAFGVIIALTILPSLGVGWPSTTVLTAVLAMLGFQLTGFLNSYKDMSENFAGTLLMMTSAFSSIIGAAVPFVCGCILKDDYTDLKRWRVVLLTLASIYAACNVFYIVFGNSKRQDWDQENVASKMGHYNCVIGKRFNTIFL
ncbi:hypothetical protein O3G_MSEX005909 [Manduca sexta]|uniref:Major facilitator superfamily (MFS) profile domain-containing protein n=1 Tax=Manduca sexta TaxID=7130 RepID=A0A921Z1S6_MANSE|nr:hypothetical protein O3G_MSEX005909 [Manduca sexta]KAG6449201.1 hypothetical protein O3G_MSEX005909 [Manduca sexta]